ncbi:Outer envelope membrane protein 7 [Camellia lanceoleosa]|uniref:Outer envelope membrane protein 7 n=1 Tax=Camellia lanceoleosa TaxID=1840588 RepID=A0ACC0GXM7_9ERIC|nr:Outer envelope membrane protein 7 [Camellia lanceoleosa]
MAKMNAMRSGVVVVGALAFGYLTFQIGFRPFLERAQHSLNNTPHLGDAIDDSDTALRVPDSPPDQFFSNPKSMGLLSGIRQRVE